MLTGHKNLKLKYLYNRSYTINSMLIIKANKINLM